MTINNDQVVLYESERLTDETDGGGRATGNVVVDGEINNLFNDISRLDRTVGDVALRKGFVGINTGNADIYLGAHAIIVEPPADPNVHVLLFDAGSEDDERLSAQQRIEAYVVQGARAAFDLLGNQFENQRQIVVVQREEQALPAAGDVFVLRNDLNQEQFVRVTEVDASIQTFTYQAANATFVDFQRRRIVMGISAPLTTLFPGGEATPVNTAMPAGSTRKKSDVFGTEVADAARYWGVKRSTQVGNIGDVSIKAASIYANLVPSAQSEQPLADQALGYPRTVTRPAADADYTGALTALYTSTTEVRVFLPRPPVRGTVQLVLGGSSYVDDGTGVLNRSSGTFPYPTLDCDYVTGTIQGTRPSGTQTAGGTVAGTATFRPGAVFSGRVTTTLLPVTLNNRGYNYIRSFTAEKPRAGTMIISYMVLGKWYELRDQGNGVLEGEGSGSINYQTGTVVATLSALPDVDSAIMFAFLMNVEEEVESHNGVVAAAIPEVVIQLDPGVGPNNLTVTYTAAGVTKTLTDDGNGNLTGDGTGTINYTTGDMTIKPTTVHDDGTPFNVTYQTGETYTATLPAANAVGSTGEVAGTLANAPILPGSVSFLLTLQWKISQTAVYKNPVRVRVTDDGAGGFISNNGTVFAGSINYSTGVYNVHLSPTRPWTRTRWVEGPQDEWGVAAQVKEVTVLQRHTEIASPIELAWMDSTPTYGAASTTHNPNELTLALIPSGDDRILPGSLLFTYGGKVYFDRDGILYHTPHSQTGAGVAVGAVDYNERTATLNTWTQGTGPGVTIHAALTVSADVTISSIAGRTPGAPLRPGSFQATVTDSNGNILTGTADNDGNISNGNLTGTINYQTGVYKIKATTNPADLTGASDVQLFTDTASYNAVLYSFLPLDAELIGLDPVRLPSDGRVPIYREGDVLVLSHTAETDVGTPAAGAQTVLARDHQAAIEVVDSAGLKLKAAAYTANLLTGTITWANPLQLETEGAVALTPPLTVRDRVEHMSVINDVQINGTLSFIAPLAHQFPAAETVISSALVWGDINSRVFNFFKQKTWSSGSPNWTADRIGDDTTANYNAVDNPIEYANNGAITERWALVFTSATAFNIVGQTLGVIGTGNTSVDVIPINPNTGNPYFVMRAAGFGAGWAAGNAIRFDTEGCLAPMWLCRTVLSGQAQEDDDRFVIQIRGDAD